MALSGRTGFLLVLTLTFGCMACGGGDKQLSKQEYEREIRAITEEALVEANPAALAAEAHSGDRTAAIRVAHSAVEEQVRKLDELRPPQDIADAHAALVAGLRQYSTELETLIGQVDQGQLTLERFQQRLQQLASVRRVQAAKDRIRSRGYSIR
jgi:hypothetical protein